MTNCHKTGRIAVGFLVLSASVGPMMRVAGQDAQQTTTLGGEPSARQARESKITTLAFLETETGAEGTAHTATVTVRHKTTPGLRVGFFDTNVEGTGPMWRASGWSAATLSCLLLGVNPEHFEFTFDTGFAWVDGPSAGGLTTIGVLAALCGDTVRDDAAMTGTINPDGTIGPVGGIPHKIDGAAKAGKKLVLIPVGQRYDYDYNLKRQVDLLQTGKDKGVEVRHVGNIFDAYEIMTGKPLPRPQQGDKSPLPGRAFDKLRATTKSLLSDYQAARSRFNSLSAEARRDREPTYADERAQLAERALEEGLAAVASQRAWEAVFDVQSSLQAALLDEVREQRGVEAMIEQLNATAANRQALLAVQERLKVARPRSASELVSLADAWSTLAVAWGANAQANSRVSYLVAQIKSDKAKPKAILNTIYEAAYDYTVSSIYLEGARNALDLGFGFGTAAPPDPERVKIVADLLRRAADANLALFESVIVEPQANRQQLSTSAMRERYIDWDGEYRDAVLAVSGMRSMEKEVREEPARSVMILGASLTAWANSALVVAKHYSLGARLDDDGNVVSLSGESALLEMFNLSEARAAELINLVQQEEPVSAMAYAENARILRQGDSADQLLGLYYNWSAAIEAHMLAYFTGHYGSVVRDELKRTGRPVELLQLWDLPSR